MDGCFIFRTGKEQIMNVQDIRVGGFYLSKTGIFVREVQLCDEDTVSYQGYLFASGEPANTGACTIATLATWAARTLDSDEIRKLHREQAADDRIERRNAYVRGALRIATNDELRGEMTRRGLR
jgi:hypothetical protein